MPTDPLSRIRLTAAEQNLRFQLQELLGGSTAMMRATLTVRERVCGKPNCKCTSGQKHKSLYLVSRQNGEVRQLYVPKHLEKKARQWVKNYLDVQELLEQISDRCWKRLEEREE